jgi:hypothetical protein
LFQIHVHMQTVRVVKLSNNPISAEGLAALATMLELNRNIVEVDVAGNLCERPFSHVHYRPQSNSDPSLDPAPGTLAQGALSKNLKYNRVCCINYDNVCAPCIPHLLNYATRHSQQRNQWEIQLVPCGQSCVHPAACYINHTVWCKFLYGITYMLLRNVVHILAIVMWRPKPPVVMPCGPQLASFISSLSDAGQRIQCRH